jgi:hypothetical protein
MKILKFIPLLLFLFRSDPVAQQTSYSFGFLGGVTLSNNSFQYDFPDDDLDESFTNDNRASFSLGGYFEKFFVRNFGLKLMANYANKGGTTNLSIVANDQEVTSLDRTYSSSLEYIQLSLVPELVVPIEKNSVSNVHFGAGGYYSFLLVATENITAEKPFSNTVSEEKKITNRLNGGDAGIVFSAGLNYRAFLMELRYDLGLSNIVDEDAGQSILSSSTRSLNILVGWSGGF